MDSIDIADPAFSLGIGGVNEIMSNNMDMSDYTTFIYIGAAILVAIIGMFMYKFYMAKKNGETQPLDCEGGFCTMGETYMASEQNQ